jgi:hypothetical protein
MNIRRGVLVRNAPYGTEGGAIAAGTMGFYEGTLNASRSYNPTGWNAVAGPALRGIGGGVVGWAAGQLAASLVDVVNSEFGDCGCGVK